MVLLEPIRTFTVLKLNNKVMNQKLNISQFNLEFAITTLKEGLIQSEEMWKENQPHAKIIGYLQGTIKGSLMSLGLSREEIEHTANQSWKEETI